MKFFNVLLIPLFAFTGSLYGVTFEAGPFSLQFGLSGDSRGTYDPIPYIAQPVCNAIEDQKRIEIIVENKEKPSKNEIKIVKKRLTVEPYAFGLNKRHQPLLIGNVVEEKQIREVTVKYTDEEEPDDQNWRNRRWDRGYLSGEFESYSSSESKSKGKVTRINIQKVQNIRIIPDSHFDIPKNLDKNFEDDIDDVICDINVNYDHDEGNAPNGKNDQPKKNADEDNDE